MSIDVMMSLLNLVRPKRKPKAPPPPPPPSRPPLATKVFTELVGLDAMRNRRLDDRRRRPRLEREGSVSIVATTDAGPRTIDAEVRDLSAEGISIDLGIALKVGAKFTMHLPRLIGAGTVELNYVVRRCEAQAEGGHLVGGELLSYRAEIPAPTAD